MLWAALGLLPSTVALLSQWLRLDDAWPPLAWLVWPFSLLVTTILLTLAYAVLPAGSPSWRELALGALVTALGIELVRGSFGIYVERVARYPLVYGTLGGVVAFLVFTYLIAVAALLGAQVAAALDRHCSRSTPAASSPDAETAAGWPGTEGER